MANEQAREIRRSAGMLAAGLGRLGLAKVDDPRVADQVKHPLARLLVTVLLGLASGRRSLREVERQTSKLSPAVRGRLKLFERVPDTTIRSVLMRLDHRALRGLLYRQVRSANRSKQLSPVGLPFGMCAIDGKYTTTRLPDGPYAQQQDSSAKLRTMTCALVSAAAPVVMDAVPIPASTNEMGIFPVVLDDLRAAYGRGELYQLVCNDAGMTSLRNANCVVEQGLDYLMALKDTQPTLLDEAVRLIGPANGLPAAAQTTDVRDNRTTERREVWLTDEAAGYHGWHHLRTMVRVRRTVLRDDEVVSQDDRYFLSSLDKGALTPPQWLLAVRNHWRVENDVHGVLDVSYKEDDAPWLHATPGQLAVAILRRVVLNLMALHRNVSRRGERKGDIPWRELIETALVVLVGATEGHLHGLRWPDIPALRPRGRPG